MQKTRLKRAHLFTVAVPRNKFFLPRQKKHKKTMFQQVYTLLF